MIGTLRRRRTRPPTLTWPEVAAADLGQYPNGIADLLERRLDGMTITGVLTQEEVDRALERLGPMRPKATAEFFGSMLGEPLSQGGHERDRRDQYLDDSDAARALYREAFGFDPQERIGEVLAPMLGSMGFGAPGERGREYNPGNVRWFDPGAGGLHAHVGNEFRALSQYWAYKELLECTRVTDHLSYFVVLQPPTEGGALSVYNLTWETFSPDKTTPWTNEGRDDAFFDDCAAVRFSPPPGAMVLFGGGWRWHRIDRVGGDRPRITYGGFMSPSLDGSTLHAWC